MIERTTEPVRRLTAIMFTDMVGYTAMVQEDEQHALRLRSRWHDVLQRRIAEFHGALLQTYGDGSLSIFDSAIAAVECAVAVQRDLRTDPRVPLRIGIHTGDIVHDAQGVFGDGVNVASRIQSLAAPGSVLISAKVYDEIKNQPSLTAEHLGAFDLKNVRRPIEVYAVVADGLERPDPRSLAAARVEDERRSVAVLPFVNMSVDPDNEVFSDGITEELINALTRVNGLRVTARTSSFAFKGQQHDVREIASKLGVGTVLEGSVRRAGERVRITAQLVDARTGYHLFSETYDRELADIFQTQDEIARAIVSAVNERLAPEQRQEKLVTARTDSAAHTVYLKGLREFHRWTPESLRAAIAWFEKAIKLDALYAPAWSGLAGAHTVLGLYGQADPAASYASAEEAAKRATALDPNDGEARATLGLLRLFADWDPDAAYVECQKAVSLSPGSTRVRQSFATLLRVRGDARAAVEEMETAVQLDPLSALAQSGLGSALFFAGRFEEAHRALDRAIELDPTFRSALDTKAWIYLLQRRYEEVDQLLDRTLAITGDPYKGAALRGFVAARTGRMDDANHALQILQERQQRNPHISLEVDFLVVFLGMGRMEDALRWLQTVIRKRNGEALFMAHDPLWRVLLSQPAFRTVLEREGIGRLTLERMLELGRAARQADSVQGTRLPAQRPRMAVQSAASMPLRAGPPGLRMVKDHPVLFGVFGAIDCKGPWEPLPFQNVVVFLGGGRIDFREAVLPGPEVEIDTYIICGGLEIVVPPTMRVDCHGAAVLGAYHADPSPEPVPPDAPVLRIGGFLLMAGVRICVRYPGETDEQAAQRMKAASAKVPHGRHALHSPHVQQSD